MSRSQASLLGTKIDCEPLALRHARPIIRVSFFSELCAVKRAADFDYKEVIMTVKKNYVPCVDLKNLHIPLT